MTTPEECVAQLDFHTPRARQMATELIAASLIDDATWHQACIAVFDDIDSDALMVATITQLAVLARQSLYIAMATANPASEGLMTKSEMADEVSMILSRMVAEMNAAEESP